MLNLVKSDFYRIIKSKLSIALLIVIFCFSFLTSGLYSLVIEYAKYSGESIDEFQGMLTGSYVFRSSFTMSNNVGLIIPIISSLFVCGDVSNGILRNKVISGHPRWMIYVSHLITNACFSGVMVFINALLNLFFGTLLLGYGSSFNGTQLIFILQMILLGLLTYMFVATISTFLSLTLKSTPSVVIVLVFVILILTFMTNIPSFFSESIFNKYENFFYLIPEYSLYSGIFSANNGALSLECMLIGIFSYLLFGGVFTGVGIAFFKFKDIK